MEFKAGRYLVDCYWHDRFAFRVDKHVTDYRIQIAWIVIDLTDMSVSTDDFMENEQ